MGYHQPMKIISRFNQNTVKTDIRVHQGIKCKDELSYWLYKECIESSIITKDITSSVISDEARETGKGGK